MNNKYILTISSELYNLFQNNNNVNIQFTFVDNKKSILIGKKKNFF